MINELKPCPFCGDKYNEVEIVRDLEPHHYDVYCGSCGITVPHISAWNTRPIEDALRAERDGAVQKYDTMYDLCELVGAELDKANALLDSQGRDHTQPCTLGTLCPWCHAESLQHQLNKTNALLDEIEVWNESMDMWGLENILDKRKDGGDD